MFNHHIAGDQIEGLLLEWKSLCGREHALPNVPMLAQAVKIHVAANNCSGARNQIVFDRLKVFAQHPPTAAYVEPLCLLIHIPPDHAPVDLLVPDQVGQDQLDEPLSHPLSENAVPELP